MSTLRLKTQPSHGSCLPSPRRIGRSSTRIRSSPPATGRPRTSCSATVGEAEAIELIAAFFTSTDRYILQGDYTFSLLKHCASQLRHRHDGDGVDARTAKDFDAARRATGRSSWDASTRMACAVESTDTVTIPRRSVLDTNEE